MIGTIKVKRDEIPPITDSISSYIFKEIRSRTYGGFPDPFTWTLKVSDFYQDLCLSENNAAGSPTHSTIQINTDVAGFTADMIEKHLLEEMDSSSEDDMDWLLAMINFYKQLRKISGADTEPEGQCIKNSRKADEKKDEKDLPENDAPEDDYLKHQKEWRQQQDQQETGYSNLEEMEVLI